MRSDTRLETPSMSYQSEQATISSLIPIGTTWMVFQVAYQNASIGNNPGFVDDAHMDILPAPGAIALLGLAGLCNRRRRN